MNESTALLEPPPANSALEPGRRILLFFLSSQSAYRSPLFSEREIFCGPDADASVEQGRIRALRTQAGAFDVRDILARIPSEQHPELLVVKADASGRNFPRNLGTLRCPKVLLVGDTHHMTRPVSSLIRYAQQEPFDLVIFDHTRHHARFFAEAGLRNLHWLPALDYGFEPRALSPCPGRPLTFVGQVGRFHPYRRWVLKKVQDAGLPLAVLRGRLSETADIYADSQMTLNVSLNGDLNLRVFEVLAAGGFLLTDELSEQSGLSRLFVPGRHLDTWKSPDQLIEKIRHYLDRPGEVARIRQQGQAELFLRHHPSVKLREFHRLVDAGEVNPRYDLTQESWWPRGRTTVAPGLPARIAAYESLQELHRCARKLTVYASKPGELAEFATLPRLELAPVDRMSVTGRASEQGGIGECAVLWWDETVPESALGQFLGDTVLAADGGDREEPRLGAWGFERAGAESPVWRLTRPLLWMHHAWEAGAREGVRARLEPLLASSADSASCLTLGRFAQLLGDQRLQSEALQRAVALDRNNRTALLALAALMAERGDSVSVAVLLEEAGRLSPLPEAVDALRKDLALRPEVAGTLASYWRAIGRGPRTQAGHPRRILIATNIFPPQELGGYGRKMWEFAHGLLARGHDVHVLTADLPALSKPPTPDEAAMEARVLRTLPLLGEWKGGVPVAIGDRAELLRRVGVIRDTVAAAIRTFRAEAVFAGNMDFLESLPIDVALAAGLPVLHALGNSTPGYSLANQPTSPRYCLGPASDWTGRAARQAGYAPARMETLYPGARVDRFFRFFPPDLGRLRICFAGLVLPYKGPHVLVDALVRLHRAGVDFSAEIAGDAPDAGYLGKLREAVRATGLGAKVGFTGFLDRTGLGALFARNNVLVFPSQFAEPFGISQVEAMAAGLVVVSSGTGGAGEIVRDGADGLLFDAKNGADLAERLYSLARDHALFSRLQKAAQTRAMAFAVEHSVEKIERLIEELLLVPATS